MKIVDYTILINESESDLAKDVREYIKKGWEPSGGVSYAPADVFGTDVFVQAMVMVKKE